MKGATVLETLSSMRDKTLCLDVSTMLALTSELVWDPDEAVKKIPPTDGVMRLMQYQHEQEYPQLMQNFAHALLRGGFKVVALPWDWSMAQQILKNLAGQRETCRFQLLKSQLVSCFTIEDLKATKPSNSKTTTEGRDDDEGEAALLSTRTETVGPSSGERATGSRTSATNGLRKPSAHSGLHNRRPVELSPGITSTAGNGRYTSDTGGLLQHAPLSDVDAYFPVPLFSAMSPVFEGTYETGAKRRRMDAAFADGSAALLGEGDEVRVKIRLKQRIRDERRKERDAAALHRITQGFANGLIKTSKKINDRHVRSLTETIRQDWVFVTSDQRLVSALKQQGYDLERFRFVLLHPPRSLVGM